MSAMSSLLVGLAVGAGTGPELAEVFEQVIHALAAPYGTKIDFVRSPRIYHSYASLLAANETDVVTEETRQDTIHYRQFCEEAAARGVRAIFRTSISAQALYLVREQLEAVKCEHYWQSPTASLVLVRDQAQGFYGGINTVEADGQAVSRTVQFRKAIFDRIITFGLTRARQLLAERTTGVAIETITLVYKFHLFDGLFLQWARDWEQTHGVTVRCVQGDTMNRNLLAAGGIEGHQVLIAANEYADLMQTVLLDRFGLGAQEGACAENIYLHPTVQGLSEWQTAHGSADDLTGQGIVNPTATIRAVAAILEEKALCVGVKRITDLALHQLAVQGVQTPDQGGSATTAAFVEGFLDAAAAAAAAASAVTSATSPASLAAVASDTALIVVDFQNDFVTQYRSPREMERISANIAQLVDQARQAQTEVIWVRFVGDPEYQPRSWRQRNQEQQRKPWCLRGTWGAELFGAVQPRATERQFEKRACYDPFLAPGFEHYLLERNLAHLVVVGLFTDVCVDATVRGAFQRGWLTTVVKDCTAGHHFTEEQWLAYMQRVYGTHVAERGALEGVWGPGPRATKEAAGGNTRAMQGLKA
ncbi:Isochorismatase hydrolase [Aspergillus ibericus CBS 121593]|uniref:Isochorismatase hydrolase n=1 Tax=Aspergillus ibericus CBS 121593 TaxID=1448316 RepID=A0A395GVG3_9EURO|nr:Isochorismatase hydrolase [Aspergillus ibericus CBS 121593]RAK99399.1 Isochorismatase hydrolase [Aspergillus ibericus CBS 121593]